MSSLSSGAYSAKSNGSLKKPLIRTNPIVGVPKVKTSATPSATNSQKGSATKQKKKITTTAPTALIAQNIAQKRGSGKTIFAMNFK